MHGRVSPGYRLEARAEASRSAIDEHGKLTLRVLSSDPQGRRVHPIRTGFNCVRRSRSDSMPRSAEAAEACCAHMDSFHSCGDARLLPASKVAVPSVASMAQNLASIPHR